MAVVHDCDATRTIDFCSEGLTSQSWRLCSVASANPILAGSLFWPGAPKVSMLAMNH
jgi:hypothetical protein